MARGCGTLCQMDLIGRVKSEEYLREAVELFSNGPPREVSHRLVLSYITPMEVRGGNGRAALREARRSSERKSDMNGAREFGRSERTLQSELPKSEFEGNGEYRQMVGGDARKLSSVQSRVRERKSIVEVDVI